MITGSASRRYAKALLRIGAAQGRLEALVREVDAVAAGYESSPELREILDDPRYAESNRQKVLDAFLQRANASRTVKSAAAMMLERGRISLLPDLARALRTMADERAGVQRAEVASATPLPESFYSKLRSELERMTGRRIELARKMDPSLIGGVVTRLGDKVYDGSIRARLADLRESLQRRD